MRSGVKLDGVTIRRVTGHNAKFIVDNKIGKGAIVRVSRRGYVIPHIEEVIKGTKAELPDDVKWEWNKTGVDIYAVENSDEVEVKRINNFFRVLGLEGISEKIFAKLYDNGYNSINKVIDAKASALAKLPGIQATMANKIVDGVKDAITNVSLDDLMNASTCFKDMGSRRLNLIVQTYPNVLDWKCDSKDIDKLASLEGFSDILASSFVNSLKEFKKFLAKLSKKVKYIIPKKFKPKTNKLANQVIVMTGFRDKDISNFIKENGGTEGSSVTNKTTILLVKDLSSTSTKAEKARALGVKIMTRENFISRYMK